MIGLQPMRKSEKDPKDCEGNNSQPGQGEVTDKIQI